ncbi:Ribophorin I [Phycomyces blakesleeanus]
MQSASLRIWLGALLVLCCAFITSATSPTNSISKTTIPIPTHFQNIKVLRIIDLRTPIVHEDIGFRAKNIGNQPVNEYYLTFKAQDEENIASINAFLRQGPKTALSIEQAGFDSEKELQLYKVTFDSPLQPDEEIRFGVKVAYTNVIEPLPKKLPQISRQHLIFNGNVYLFSPYNTEEIKTTLQLPNEKILSYTGNDEIVVKTGNKIIYGPFQNIPAESYNILSCHYEYLKPVLTLTSLRRDFQLSHWGGNLAVEEHFALRHDGAKMEEPFNRAKYQLSRSVHAQTNVLQHLPLELPAHARDIYYRDDIGNVSTSALTYGPSATILDIKPRYPLYGGWNYTWFHGYNIDLGYFARYSKKSGVYILNFKFVENVIDMAVEKVEVNVILPEGAKNVKVNAPFKLDSIEHTKHFTNFDTTGHYKVVLKKFNVINEHSQPIQARATMSTFFFLTSG